MKKILGVLFLFIIICNYPAKLPSQKPAFLNIESPKTAEKYTLITL